MKKIHARIVGLGKYLPDKVLTNEDLERMVETSDEWITKRVGVRERRISAPDVFASHLAAEAGRNALADAHIAAEDLDLILISTVTPDMYQPSVSCLVQKELGARRAAAFDINAACPGFVFSLTTATQFIENGMYKTVLVIGTDTLSKITEYQDRSTCVLFGDGAGAAVVQATDTEEGVQTCYLGSDGANGDCLTIPGLRCDGIDKERRPFGNPCTLWMDGGAVFKFALKSMDYAARKVVEDAGKTLDDIKLVVPHQANIRIIEGARKRLGIPEEKMFSNIEKYGNMSSACIPIALCEAVEQGRAGKGDWVVLVSMGGGLTWGAVLLTL